jgi:hypothetical protein
MGLELDDVRYTQITNRSRITCIHGGSVTIQVTTKTRNYYGTFPAKWTDTAVVSGCPFRANGKAQPCTRVHWTTNDPFHPVDGVPGVSIANVGLCKAANGAVQGIAIVASAF